MARHFKNFIKEYTEYCKHLEAPGHFHVWTAISILGGALGGKCFIDMGSFKWKPNCFIIFVAPPGIIAKSTTSRQGTELLRKVPDVFFGPSSATWQGLTEKFRASQMEYRVHGEDLPMACLNLECSELGTFLNFNDTEMIDILVDMWDGTDKPWVRQTKGEGEIHIESPWINLIGCTTPSWIRMNMPEYAIGGGFTSRCIFVFADQKEKYVPYPIYEIKAERAVQKRKLVEDLIHLSQMSGKFTLSSEAAEWGHHWYIDFFKNMPLHMKDNRVGGYVARKQTHMHKIAMILSASQGDSKVITRNHLQQSLGLLNIMEQDMAKVFTSITSDYSAKTYNSFIEIVKSLRSSKIDKENLFTMCVSQMGMDNFQTAVDSASRAGILQLVQTRESEFYRINREKLTEKFYQATEEDLANAREIWECEGGEE